MAICSFLGTYRMYDPDIYEKLQQAVDEIVQKNKEIEFWFYNYQDIDFFDLCFAAAWEVKQHYPEKNVILAKIVRNERADEYIWNLEQWDTVTPQCVIDKVIPAPLFPEHPNKSDATSIAKKIERWVIKQSTHVVSYLYPGHFELENQYLELAMSNGAEILDVTNGDTAAFIIESIDDLKDRERMILKNLLAGNSLKEIGEVLGVSSSAVQQASSKAAHNLRKNTGKRLWKRSIEAKDAVNPTVCSIFSLGDVTYESLSAFEQAVVFLVKKYHVTQFNILCEYCKTGYMSVLNSLSKRPLMSASGRMHLIAITHCPDINSMTREEWHNAASPYCPPCHAVENIDTHTDNLQEQVLRAIDGLVQQSDFCICHLSDNPVADRISGYISGVKHIKVLDISKTYVGAE